MIIGICEFLVSDGFDCVCVLTLMLWVFLVEEGATQSSGFDSTAHWCFCLCCLSCIWNSGQMPMGDFHSSDKVFIWVIMCQIRVQSYVV